MTPIPLVSAVAGPRIVSLLPSATEIVAGFGLADNLVGRSHECDFPEGVGRLPICSAPKIPIDGSSYEIDQRVKAILAEGLSMYRVDTDRLRALRPDFVLTQTQCAVCAVTPDDVEEALCAWTDGRPTLLSLEPNDLTDVWGDMYRLGDALGVPTRARDLVESLTARLAELRKRSAGAGVRPTVAAIEWLAPLMAGGNWMPDLIETAGGASLFAESGQHSPWLDWEALVAADPDVILLLPCGFRIERSIADLGLLAEHPGWARLRAVKSGRVYIIDGHHFFNRPGPRLVESAEIVAEILHPDRFNFGHRGTGWIALDDGLQAGRQRMLS